MCASEEIPPRYRSEWNILAISDNNTAWTAMIDPPHSRYTGAAAIPSKLLCEASTATTLISSALDSVPAPGSRANGVCAATSPATVAIRTVHVVADTMLDKGSRSPSQADAAATSKAPPSHINMSDQCAGPRTTVSATAMSALEVAPVQRLKAGAIRATENSTTTHIE